MFQMYGLVTAAMVMVMVTMISEFVYNVAILSSNSKRIIEKIFLIL
jgi:hypothetical protein